MLEICEFLNFREKRRQKSDSRYTIPIHPPQKQPKKKRNTQLAQQTTLARTQPINKTNYKQLGL